MTIFHYAVDSDGIATITWDLPEKSMNVLNEAGIRELDAAVDKAIGDDTVKGIIITSGKKDFAGGMDLNVIARMKAEAGDNPAQGLYDGIMALHKILRKLELAGGNPNPKQKKVGKPVVWASPGTSAGIGTEIGLACHYRIAADNPKAKIGLPEILVGIFPGSGGTTRVSRMLGIMGASPILLEGKMMAPKAAKAAGLIDEVVDGDQLLSRAKEWLLSAGEAEIVKPWDQKGYKFPGGAPYHPAGFMTFTGANAMVHGKTKGVYPATKAMLSAIYEGALVPFDRAIEIEARWFTNVLLNPSSSAMIETLFINKEAIEKGANRPDVPDQSVKKLGVLGAGMMGAGIAFVAARAGIETILIDRDMESVERGMASIAKILDDGIKRKKVTEEQKAEILARVTGTEDYRALSGADLIVEAVFEDPAIKAEATAKAEPELATGGVFATNTSTLPISELAKASMNAENYIGIHFFSPVHKMNLVEIIRGKDTGDLAVAKALDFVRQIKKTPIVVNDARFFYANRCIIPYINEGIRMVSEGVSPVLIENAAGLLGFPVGPLQLTDETSVDLGVKIAKATRAALGADYDDGSDEVLFKLYEEGRLGRKVKAGFYDYDENGKRTGLWAGLEENWPSHDTDAQTVETRLITIQVLEAIRALEENVLMDIREGDVAAILGWGFAPWSGGPFHYVDIVGAVNFAKTCDELTARFGKRFETPKLIREMAKSGKTFYGANAKAA